MCTFSDSTDIPKKKRVHRRKHVTGMTNGLKHYFKPRVLSTILDDDFNKLPESLPTEWPVPDEIRSQVWNVDLMKLLKRWDTLNYMFNASYWNITMSAGDARHVTCGMDLPKGDTKLVVYQRKVPARFPNLFVFSECYFLVQSIKDCIESGDEKADGLLNWSLASLEDNSGQNEISVATSGDSSQSHERETLTILQYTESEKKPQAQIEESALASRADGDLEAGQYGIIRQIQNQTSSASGIQYFLCCQGLKQSEIVDMVLTVANVVGEGDGNISLTCPYEVRDFMEVLLGFRLPETASDTFFGRRLGRSRKVHETDLLVRFGMPKDTLRSLAAVINLLRKTYSPGVEFPGMEDLFDIQYARDKHSGEEKSFMSALKKLELDFISRKETDTSQKPENDKEADNWSEEKLNGALREAGKAAGKTWPFNREEKRKSRAKPPMVVFVEDTPYKVLWHSKGRTVIEFEHKIKFTGTGVKVRRTTIMMWLAIVIGIGLVIAYFAARGSSSDVSFEDLLQSALSIAALYAATVIPMVYYMYHNDEELTDVLSGRIHLDKRYEFEMLREVEKLYLCLRALKERQSDRRFIDTANTCYVVGTEVGGAMHLTLNPCIGSLLMVGFKYWEDKDTDRRGLKTRKGLFFELKEVQSDSDGNPGVYYPEWTQDADTATCPLLHAREVKKPENLRTDVTDCPIEHYYVGGCGT